MADLTGIDAEDAAEDPASAGVTVADIKTDEKKQGSPFSGSPFSGPTNPPVPYRAGPGLPAFGAHSRVVETGLQVAAEWRPVSGSAHLEDAHFTHSGPCRGDAPEALRSPSADPGREPRPCQYPCRGVAADRPGTRRSAGSDGSCDSVPCHQP